MQRLLLLSGAIGAGKTSAARVLISQFEFQKISSSDYLRSLIPQKELLTGDNGRHQLQELGDKLDEETDFSWIVDPVSTASIKNHPEVRNWLIDAVRKERQVELFRAKFGDIIRHVHLTAPEDILRTRHSNRTGDYDKAVNHPNEICARSLGKISDLEIDTTQKTPRVIANQILSLWEPMHA